VTTQPTATDLTRRIAAAYAAGVPRAPADDGMFGPTSVTWRMHRDPAALLGGLRSLLLQALHPLAMAGVDQHSNWREDPFGRLASTINFMTTVVYGDQTDVDAAVTRVARVHDHVHGLDSVTRRTFSATDPVLLLWVHGTFVASTLAAVNTLGGGLSDVESDRYVEEMAQLAVMMGVAPGRVPVSVASLEDYLDSMRPNLLCTPAARELLAYLLVPEHLDEEWSDLWASLRHGVLAILPSWAAELYGYATSALTSAQCDEIRQVLGLLDTMLLGEADVLEARQRIALRVRQAPG
jgi:uncharacterized protein (DUF2236 family)